MEAQIPSSTRRCARAAAPLDLQPVLAGILPDDRQDRSRPREHGAEPRYQTLNRVMNAARGEAYDFSIKGIDELTCKHDS